MVVRQHYPLGLFGAAAVLVITVGGSAIGRRDQGGVPGIHATTGQQPVAVAGTEARPRPRGADAEATAVVRGSPAVRWPTAAAVEVAMASVATRAGGLPLSLDAPARASTGAKPASATPPKRRFRSDASITRGG